MSIWRWANSFSNVPEAFRLTLGEGNTPLVFSRHIGPRAGLPRLCFKLETTNPSGSYKDRFAAAAVSDMLAKGKSLCIASSSGNTGSALASYCAAARIRCEIAIVETAPVEKLQQMMAYGAHIFKVRGFGTSAEVTSHVFKALQAKGASPDAALQISAFAYSPIGMAGVKSISYELAEQAGSELKHLFAPAGGGGLTLAVARGFEDLIQANQSNVRPQVHCVQPRGNDTIASALRGGEDRAHDVTCTTKISGLQVASVIDGHNVIDACKRSGGTGHLVEDETVWNIQSQLAREEGIFCEPAGAVPVAAALQARAEGLVASDEVICCLITGNGFKDAPSISRMIGQETCPLLDSVPG
jgi:threonine synthase